MKIFLSLTFIFVTGSLLGYLIELIFRRIVHKTWINPGFLKGPYLPLYGSGLTLLYCIAIIPFDSFINELWLSIILKIVLVGIVMTLIELITGLIFIKGMNIQLWDYSDRKLNYKGIICPLFSFFWAIIGAAYVLLLHPLIVDAVIWFTNNIYYSFFVGIFFGFILFDFVTSMSIALKIKEYAKQHQIIIKYERLKEHLKTKSREIKEKVHFLIPFNNFPKITANSNLPAKVFLDKLKKKKDNKNN